MFMDEKSTASIEQAKEAALRVLLHNAHGPFQGTSADCRGLSGTVYQGSSRSLRWVF